VNVSDLARQVGIAPSAVRWYEATGVISAAMRRPNGYRAYGPQDLARLRLVVSLRRLGLSPDEAGRLAGRCVERGALDLDLRPLLAEQRAAIARQRDDLDRLDGELTDLELTIAAAGRAAAGRAAAGRTAMEELPVSDAPIRVLFVCTGNSARSQLAEALLERFGGADFHVESAGTEPKGVNPYTIRALAGRGIDWSAARSKSVEAFVGQPWDYVITVCDRARQSCPVFPGRHNSLHWGLEDPAEVAGTDAQKLAAFERTILELTQRLRPFVEIALRAAGRQPQGRPPAVFTGG
jgi:arsenate reductase